MPVRHADGPGEAMAEAVALETAALVERSASSRAVMRLRAWVVCLSFAVCLPAAGRWELSWPVRAVATLVSAAVGVAALPRSGHAALPSSAPARAAVLVAPSASRGALPAPPREQRNRAPGCDGRQLYLELCILTC